MAQKRILTDDGHSQLNRLKQQRDKLYVDNQNKVYMILEKNRSVDLRHEMRLNCFEKIEQVARKRSRIMPEYSKGNAQGAIVYLNLESNDVGRRAMVHLGKAVSTIHPLFSYKSLK